MSSPIQIRVRTSLQQFWKGNQHWDHSPSLEDNPDMKEFSEELESIPTIHIKLHYLGATKQPVHKEIHVFSYASSHTFHRQIPESQFRFRKSSSGTIQKNYDPQPRTVGTIDRGQTSSIH